MTIDELSERVAIECASAREHLILQGLSLYYGIDILKLAHGDDKQKRKMASILRRDGWHIAVYTRNNEEWLMKRFKKVIRVDVRPIFTHGGYETRQN